MMEGILTIRRRKTRPLKYGIVRYEDKEFVIVGQRRIPLYRRGIYLISDYEPCAIDKADAIISAYQGEPYLFKGRVEKLTYKDYVLKMDSEIGGQAGYGRWDTLMRLPNDAGNKVLLIAIDDD